MKGNFVLLFIALACLSLAHPLSAFVHGCSSNDDCPPEYFCTIPTSGARYCIRKLDGQNTGFNVYHLYAVDMHYFNADHACRRFGFQLPDRSLKKMLVKPMRQTPHRSQNVWMHDGGIGVWKRGHMYSQRHETVNFLGTAILRSSYTRLGPLLCVSVIHCNSDSHCPKKMSCLKANGRHQCVWKHQQTDPPLFVYNVPILRNVTHTSAETSCRDLGLELPSRIYASIVGKYIIEEPDLLKYSSTSAWLKERSGPNGPRYVVDTGKNFVTRLSNSWEDYSHLYCVSTTTCHQFEQCGPGYNCFQNRCKRSYLATRGSYVRIATNSFVTYWQARKTCGHYTLATDASAVSAFMHTLSAPGISHRFWTKIGYLHDLATGQNIYGNNATFVVCNP